MILNDLTNLTELHIYFSLSADLRTPIVPRSLRAALHHLSPNASLRILCLRNAYGLAVSEIAGIRSLKCLKLTSFSLAEGVVNVPHAQDTTAINLNTFPCRLDTLHLEDPLYVGGQQRPAVLNPFRALLALWPHSQHFVLPLAQLRALKMDVDYPVEDVVEVIKRQGIRNLEELSVNIRHSRKGNFSVWLDNVVHLQRLSLRLLAIQVSMAIDNSTIHGAYEDVCTTLSQLMNSENVLEGLEIRVEIMMKHPTRPDDMVPKTTYMICGHLFRLASVFGSGKDERQWRHLRNLSLRVDFVNVSSLTVTDFVQELKTLLFTRLALLFQQSFQFHLDVVTSP
ncbi:hypothetical protein CVT24_008574 [Panaeolus cyanescens]|uniref:Uncharacterized protein n=1 Tax=Panaeolus cyanescens TaxID=181874 RepID=A0A409VKX9_9AGAR|nr:hypothetical protein CVT24_008574 [Panaeolus cyanescens]